MDVFHSLSIEPRNVLKFDWFIDQHLNRNGIQFSLTIMRMKKCNFKTKGTTTTAYDSWQKYASRSSDMTCCFIFCSVYTHPVLTAAKVPLGMSLDGFRRSPLMLMPAMIPVTVGKNTPNTVNQLLSSWKSGNVLLTIFSYIHPGKPLSEILNKGMQKCY